MSSASAAQGLLVLPCICGVEYTHALIDSGATHNFISAEHLANFPEASIFDAAPMQVCLANQEQVLSSSVASVRLVFGPSIQHEVEFRVVPKLNYPLILGMEWLSSCNPVINWTERSVTIDDCTLSLSCNATTADIPLCTMEQLQQIMDQSVDATLFAVSVQPQSTDTRSTEGCQPSRTDDKWQRICSEYTDVFDEPQRPQQRDIKHEIKLVDSNAPVRNHRQYRMSQKELDEVRVQLDKLLAKGWIRPSTSAYNHPILFVKKKDGSMRMCIDYRSLNSNTVVDRYPLPRIDDILDRLGRSTVYSKIDLAQGYHQVDIAESDRHKTAFQSRFSLFEYTVLPFGLCNAPSTFQRLMNTIFWHNLDVFVTVYLDDILIFSANEHQHEQHLRWVLDQLRAHGLHAKRSKCEFGLRQLEYLGHIITPNGVSVDPSKVSAIRDVVAPTCVKELQMFLGMCNYYARFVKSYAWIAKPLYALLGGDVEWAWGKEEQAAFEQLKHALCTTPVLAMPDFKQPFTIETDASDFAVGGVLVQHDRPVAYYSRMLTSAQKNYPVHDRELLAIVEACARWRPYIDGQVTRVFTDHKPLVHLQTQRDLNKRQVHWLEKLAQTPLNIEYRPGVEAVVPDFLSRPVVARVEPTGSECLPDNTAVDEGLHVGRPSRGTDTVEPRGGRSPREASSTWDDVSVLNTILAEPQFLARVSAAQHAQDDREMVALVAKAEGQHPDFCIRVVHGVPLLYRRPPSAPHKQQLVLPAGMRQLILDELHVSALAGHLGVRKMCDLLSQRVWWPKLGNAVTRYVANCDVCKRTKDSTQHPHGALEPLAVPTSKFQSWSMDFITDLPVGSDAAGYNAVFTCVDRLTKLTRLVPCVMGDAQLTAPAVAKLFFDNIVRHFGVPSDVVHDRDPRFTSLFWKELWSLLGTKVSATSAYHPQSDGQTERQHRTIEQLLRAHLLDFPTSSWSAALPYVEFAINTTVNASTGAAPFTLVYGQHVQLPLDLVLSNVPTTDAPNFVETCQRVVEDARLKMTAAQQYQKRYYDARHRPVEFSVGDEVLLSTKNLPLASHTTKKLAPRFVGPFPVLARLGSQSYRLELPASLAGIHPVFHVSLLRAPASGPGVPPSSLAAGPGPVEAPGPTDDQYYEVEKIVGHRLHRGVPQLLVRYLGYDESEDAWLPLAHLRETAPALVLDWQRSQSRGRREGLRSRS